MGDEIETSKTKAMIVSRSSAMHLQSSALTIVGTVLKESNDLVIFGVTFDYLDTSIPGVVSKQLRILCGRVGDSTTW